MTNSVESDKACQHHFSKRTQGAVACSKSSNQTIACCLEPPHISAEGCRLAQTFGRDGEPKIRQRKDSSSWMQGVFAGLPKGIPGIGEEIDGAVQQAPQ